MKFRRIVLGPTRQQQNLLQTVFILFCQILVEFGKIGWFFLKPIYNKLSYRRTRNRVINGDYYSSVMKEKNNNINMLSHSDQVFPE